MPTDNRSLEELLSENETLRLRLEEAEETLYAIQSGEVDALVISSVSGESQVFSLQGAEHPYRVLVETMNEGATFLDTEGIIVYCNRQLANMLKVPMEKLVGSPLSAYVAAEDLATLAYHLANTDGRGRNEITLKTATEGRLPVVFSCAAIDMAGKPGVSVVFTDIRTIQEAERQLAIAAERERATQAIHQSEERLRLALDASQMGIFDWDIKTGKIIWTRHHEKLWGFQPGEFGGTYESFASRVHPNDLPGVNDKLACCIANMKPFSLEFRVVWPDGSQHWIAVWGEFAIGYDKMPWHMRGAVVDITEQKLTKLKLENIQFTLSEAQRIAHVGSFEYMAETKTTVWSDEEFRIYGLTPGAPSPAYDDLLAKFIHPDDADLLNETFTAAIQSNSIYELEHRIVLPDGSARIVYDRAHPYFDEKGNLVRYVGATLDITESKQAEMRLQLAASVFTHSREGIIITDAVGTIIEVNYAFTYITGYPREEALGRKSSILKSGRHDPAFYAALWHDLTSKGHWYGEIWNRRKNGEVYAEMITISAVRDADGQTKHYVALFSDITPMKMHQQQLEHIAHYDGLTGLPNRLLLSDRLEQAMAQTQRHGGSLAVAYLDLDGFKAINDEHGHSVGDALLVAIAGRMKAVLREVDTLARIGGDEFVAALVDLEHPTSCEPLIERLLRAAADPVMVGQAMLHISASIGVTIYPQDEANANAGQLLRHADQAMYVAKQSGRNRYSLFGVKQDTALKAEQENLADIRRALDRHEFVLHYQPKVNMKTGAVMGVEALIRWQHPQRGMLLPADFMPNVENHAYGIELGEWVIDAAFTQMAVWHGQNFDMPVSVNIAAYHLQRDGFVPQLRERFSAHPTVRPEQFEMEVLESSALEDLGNASKIMRACCEMGVHFALDDFGTGYSSLTYLKRLPVDILKIDQSFVCDMLNDPEDLSIIEGVIGLAKSFHRQVIAEGVETASQGERLLTLGCNLAQGYVIANPMPGAELPGWVAAWLRIPQPFGH